jgi:hypothetical protein
MRMTPVVSPNIYNIGYEPASQNLYVQFANGFVYEYRNVSPNVYAELMNADLVDVYLNQYMRDQYPYRRMMRLLPVESTSIGGAGYDMEAGNLYVKFNNGFTYEYRNVPPAVYATLMNADSIGAYFNRNIRGRYPYRRIWVERTRRLQLAMPTVAPWTVPTEKVRQQRRSR